MSKFYIEFSNAGEVPVNAFKLLGASSKRGDESKIGYFGTGLKYAIAVLLREEIPFKVFSGDKEVKIGLRKTKFMDQDVRVITVNGEKTSITLEAGINWLPWFAVREIYSNTIDENGTMKTRDDINPEAGYTKIYIESTEKLSKMFDNWSDFFSNTRDRHSESTLYGSVLQKTTHENLIIFRKGIQAYRGHDPSVFDYDVPKLAINESRVAERDYEARQRAAEAFAQCDNEEAIRTFVHCSMQMIEKKAEFWDYLFDDRATPDGGMFTSAWFKVLEPHRIVPLENAGFYGMTPNSIALPEKLCKHLYKQYGDKLQIMGSSNSTYIMTRKSADFVKPYLEQLTKVGLGCRFESIKIVRFKEEAQYGEFDKNMVLLSEKLKDPVNEDLILPVLFEEIAHGRSGYSDNTRSFQDYIIGIACGLVKTANKGHKLEVKVK